MSLAVIRRWRDMDRWTPRASVIWTTTFPRQPLGDVLIPRHEPVSAVEFSEHAAITIRFDGSMELRERAEPFGGSMFAAHPGDVVFSKIDVRNGAIALVPESFGKVVVTSEYPIHRPDSRRLDARYFAMLLRTPNFMALLQDAASGTSGRKRVNAESFEEIEIPLPEPAAQRALVEAYESELRAAAVAEQEAAEIELRGLQEFEAALGLTPPPDLPRRPVQIARFRDIDRWSHEGIILRQARTSALAQQTASGEDTVALGEYVEVTHGCSASPSPIPTSLKVLKISAVTRGTFRPLENKFATDDAAVRRRFGLKRGDVLMCRVNGTLRYVGMSALISEDMPDLIFPDKLIRVRIVREGLNAEFLWKVLQSPTIRAQIEAGARTAVGNHAIGSRDVNELEILLPKPDAQLSMMRKLSDSYDLAARRREEAKTLRTAAWDTFLAAVFS